MAYFKLRQPIIFITAFMLLSSPCFVIASQANPPLTAEELYKQSQYYLSGAEGFPQDKDKALECAYRAAEMGQPQAQFLIGDLHENGIRFEKSEEIALEWYEKAAEQGNPDAQYRIGKYYSFGIVFEKDDAKAVEWYTKAAINNDAMAQYNLALAYHQGMGADQDLNKAVDWYKKAAFQGFNLALYNLGSLYYNKGSYKTEEGRDSLAISYAWFKSFLKFGDGEAKEYAQRGVNNLEENLDKPTLKNAEVLYEKIVSIITQNTREQSRHYIQPGLIPQ